VLELETLNRNLLSELDTVRDKLSRSTQDSTDTAKYLEILANHQSSYETAIKQANEYLKIIAERQQGQNDDNDDERKFKGGGVKDLSRAFAEFVERPNVFRICNAPFLKHTLTL
jgi:hypothetical protein